MKEIFEQLTRDLEKKKTIQFGTFASEIDGFYNDCHPYSQDGLDIKYYLADISYDDFTVECCIYPNAYFSAAQAGEYAPISIKIKDNATQKVVFSCTHTKSKSYSFKGSIIGYCVSCKSHDKGYNQILSRFENGSKPNDSLSQKILTQKINDQDMYEDVNEEKLDEYININGMPSPEQIRGIAQLIFEKTRFFKSRKEDICMTNGNGIVESSANMISQSKTTTTSTTPDFSAEDIAKRIPDSNPFNQQHEKEKGEIK